VEEQNINECGEPTRLFDVCVITEMKLGR